MAYLGLKNKNDIASLEMLISCDYFELMEKQVIGKQD